MTTEPSRPANDALDGVRDTLMVERAVHVVAQVERRSRLLASLPRPDRRQLVRGAMAIGEGVDLPSDLPVEAPEGEARPVEHLPPTGADLVLVGRTDNYLRLRAFYLDARLTLALHVGWPPWPLTSQLHRGAALRGRLPPIDSLVVPRALETGRGLRHAWLVEELVGGCRPAASEWQAVGSVLLDRMIGIWRGDGVRRRPARALLPPSRVRSAVAIIESEPGLDLDRARLATQAWELSRLPGDLLHGLTHGDPQRSNVLIQPDGGLALVDWEAARRRLVAHDSVKVLDELVDPLPVVERLAENLAGLGVVYGLPWRQQVAIACLIRLAGTRRWISRATVARLRGLPEVERRVALNRRASVRLLERLLLEP
jgi:hypothetical protein